jgi:hypothetical protein
MTPQILAATVFFSGLIVHVEMNPATHQRTAYLLDDSGGQKEHQTPRLVVTSGFASASGFTSLGGGAFSLKTKKQYVIVPSNLSGGVNEMPEFKNRIPHLSKIISNPSAMPHTDVLGGKNHNSHATVTYVNGTLGTDRCFKNAIKFSPHDTGEQCLGQSVKLTINTNDDWEIHEVGNSSNKIVVHASGEVRIENVAPVSSTNLHQKNYKLLLDRNVTVDDYVRTRTCDEVNCTITSAPQPVAATRPKRDRGHQHPGPVTEEFNPAVECSNTQWP